MGSWPSSRRTASVWPPYLALTIVSLNLRQTQTGDLDTGVRVGVGGEREGKGCQQNKMKKQQEFSRGNYWFNSAVWPLR